MRRLTLVLDVLAGEMVRLQPLHHGVPQAKAGAFAYGFIGRSSALSSA